MKNKNKNQYGTFHIATSMSRKKSRVLIAALTVIFISAAAGFLFIKNKNKPVQLAQTQYTNPIPAWWYQQYFGASVCDKDNCKPDADPDVDKLTNVQEYFYHTSPFASHTVNDELDDGQLVAAGFDPSKPGRKTFEELVSEESLLGESLVFDQDIKKLVADSNDLGKVVLPEVKQEEIKILYTEDPLAYSDYAKDFRAAVNKYFSERNMPGIRETIKSGSEGELYNIKLKAQNLSLDLKSLPVPFRLMLFHKYNIIMFQLLSEILPQPTDLASVESEIWYDKVQAFLVIQQRLEFEVRALENLVIK